MAAFGGMQITNVGRALQAKAQTGVQLQFTRIGVGSGSMSGQQIADMTALIQPRMSLELNKLQTRPGGKALVGAPMSNDAVVTGFYFRELAVFAVDPNVGEIMYCYANAGAGAEYIPAGGGPDIVEKQIDVISLIGNAANVSATIDDSLVFATKQELYELITLSETAPSNPITNTWWYEDLGEIPDIGGGGGGIVIGNASMTGDSDIWFDEI